MSRKYYIDISIIVFCLLSKLCIHYRNIHLVGLMCVNVFVSTPYVNYNGRK